MKVNPLITKTQNLPHINQGKILKTFDSWLCRSRDIILSTLGMIMLSPIGILIAILIKRDSHGPVFYRGTRVGKNGKNFIIYKFRTMYEEEVSYQGPKITAKDDPRITPIGRWLRDSKINELPQLWNVLIGDMSLIGPRPEDPAVVLTWPDSVRKEILSVRPGITSPASVLYRDEESMLNSDEVMDQYFQDILPSKLRLDQLYVRYRTFLADLDAIFWTLIVLSPYFKRFSIPEHLLYWGPLSLFIDRYITWFVSDFLVSFVSVTTAGIIWRAGAPLDVGIYKAVPIALAYALFFSLTNALLGLNRISWARAHAEDALTLIGTSLFSTAVVFVLNLLWPGEPLLPPTMLMVAGVFSFFGFVSIRYRTRLLTGFALRWLQLRNSSMSGLGERVLIIGAGDVGEFTTWLLQRNELVPAFSIAGYVDDDPRKIGSRVSGYPVLGTTQDIPDLVDRYDVGLLIMAITNANIVDQERITSLCEAMKARLLHMSDVLDNLRAYFPSNEKEHEQFFGRLIRNTTVDKITGAYNRYQFMKLAEREYMRALRYNHPLSALFIHVSRHIPGDPIEIQSNGSRILRSIADVCRNSIRQVDILGYFDRNEFILLLPETNEFGSRTVVERFYRGLATHPYLNDCGEEVKIQVGIATTRDDYNSILNLIQTAKENLASPTSPLLERRKRLDVAI